MNPKIYYTRLSDYTFSMSETENSSFPLSNLKTYFEDDLWKSSTATNGQTLTIDFGSAKACDFISVADHAIFLMTSVVLEAANDSGFSSGLVTVIMNMALTTPTIDDNYRTVFEFSAVSRRYWRIRYADTNSLTPQAGQIYLDSKLEFQTPYDWGYKKDTAEFVTQESVAIDGRIRSSQAYSGRYVHEFSFSLQNNATRTAFQTFVETVRGRMIPFYFFDADGTSIYYVVADQDSLPVEGVRSDQNAIKRLGMKEQRATRS